MKQRLSKEQAVAAADALLSRGAMFGDSWIGRLLKRWGAAAGAAQHVGSGVYSPDAQAYGLRVAWIGGVGSDASTQAV